MRKEGQEEGWEGRRVGEEKGKMRKEGQEEGWEGRNEEDDRWEDYPNVVHDMRM